MKIKVSAVLFFVLSCFHAQEIIDKDVLKKCRREYNKKICLSDKDNDGLLFYLDKCPDEIGSADNFGCPFTDVDNDGILDKDDPCPTIFGPPENNGCPWPDTDGDRILDHEDSCPTVWGPKTNNGCPICNKK